MLHIRTLSSPSAKDGEQLTEEKDGAAFDGMEKGGEPLNPNKAETPDKKAAAPAAAPAASGNDGTETTTAPKAVAEGEEKKSNGAHTPV